ncbi:MAG TPA: AAA family ATPase [Thermoanaerobaculia bacterium]|nr:AAA family ATPase [Thermoanaerobaculia bacterium]
MTIRELTADELHRASDPDSFGFETTAEAEPLTDIVGHPRATAALSFGVDIEHPGFNVFALGPAGIGKHHAVAHFVERGAAERPAPPDWCYVHNFEQPHRPRLLRLSAGVGRRLAADMERLVRELGSTLAAAFESDEYQARRGGLEEEIRERQAALFDELQRQAGERGLVAMRSPGGIAFAPRREGEVIDREQVMKLPDEEREKIEAEMQAMQGEVEKALRQVPGWQREHRQRVLALHEEITRVAVGPLFDELEKEYGDEEQVAPYLAAVRADVVEHARDFLQRERGGGRGESDGGGGGLSGLEPQSLRRYGVNVVVDHGGGQAAPIVHEDNPSFGNLIGRIEHLPRMGALVTDFQLIKAGALAQASGGYLMLEADKLLRQPFAWEGLKRALTSGQVKIESPGQGWSPISTVTLEPEPIPLDVKVVLTGERRLYYLLAAADPELSELFKVAADFSDEVDRDAEGEHTYARLIATLVQRDELRPFDKAAVARVIDEASRLLGDSEKLTTQTSMMCDLVRESDHWARRADHPLVVAEDVERAIAERVYRANRIEERMRQEILRETVFIDTDGERVGTVNGLAVLNLGGYLFGRPSRITARIRMGAGEVVNIEREAKLSGPLHSKGVLILASFVAARYAAERPLSLSANLVFEQSYGGVDGDSASSTELYALLSAIAEVPIRQGIAVTGSVNQHGEVQPIGGVNQKIEGFFEVCLARGLTGDQGVLVPAANVKHLMLRSEVVEAVAAGRFHIWAVDHVDQGIEVLTGLPAGEPDADGGYPEGSVNQRVARRIADLAEKRRRFTSRSGDGRGGDGGEGDGGPRPEDGGPDEPPPVPPPEPPSEPPPEPPAEPPEPDPTGPPPEPPSDEPPGPPRKRRAASSTSGRTVESAPR